MRTGLQPKHFQRGSLCTGEADHTVARGLCTAPPPTSTQLHHCFGRNKTANCTTCPLLNLTPDGASMRLRPCSVSLSILGGMQFIWLLAMWTQAAEHTPFEPPSATCVVSDRGVLRAWSCSQHEATRALQLASEQNRLRAALGARPCWWYMTNADFQSLQGIGPVAATHLVELVKAGNEPSLFQLDRVPRIGTATALRIMAGVTTECR